MSFEAAYLQALEARITDRGGSVPPITTPTSFERRNLELLDSLVAACGGSAVPDLGSHPASVLAKLRSAILGLGGDEPSGLYYSFEDALIQYLEWLVTASGGVVPPENWPGSFQSRVLALVGAIAAEAGYDPDAQAYFTAVAAADGQEFEPAVKDAWNVFVLGCKADASPNAGVSNWDAIKVFVPLFGARTLAGSLVPLAGAAPTNFGFVAGDYNRMTGLKGDGVSKYLGSNRAANASPRDNAHLAVYVREVPTIGVSLMGHSAGSVGSDNLTTVSTRFRSSAFEAWSVTSNTFVGMSRNSGSNYQRRMGGVLQNISGASDGVLSFTHHVFARNSLSNSFSNPRLQGYSIGEAVDLALLDGRWTTLVNAITGALA